MNAKNASKGTKSGPGVSVDTVKLTVVVGDTYRIKEQLKAKGAKWSSSTNGWAFTDGKKAAAAVPKNGAGVSVEAVDLTVLVGDTFRFKDKLPKLGGVWDFAAYAWAFESVEKATAALAKLK